jgi:uncharacterized damage-inducible protein DinB
MQSFFQDLFDYNHHYNSQIIEAATQHPQQVSERAFSLLNHILNAHQIWNNRIQPAAPCYDVWQVHQKELLSTIEQTNYNYTTQLLATCNLQDLCHYANSKGAMFTNTIRDIFFHVINHSNYHRAQIATEFKRVGLQPLATDYIFYKR